MFGAEARGLSLLDRSHSLKVPSVVHHADAGDFQFLLMEYIEGRRRIDTYWERFGLGLAALHKNSSIVFGLDHDNYIGSLPQRNNPSASWIEFFTQERLNSQLQKAIEGGRFDYSVVNKFERLFSKLPALLPEEPPSLLHGDLWRGNIMTTSEGKPCIIDPAVYFGHREVDLAMTQLFGGFDSLFLESYNRTFPLTPGYEERVDIFNLYPLLVHVNLFGGGYRSQVVSILDRFV